MNSVLKYKQLMYTLKTGSHSNLLSIMPLPILHEHQVIARLRQQTNPFFNDYYAFYSSWFNGVITDPHFMLVPIDDHLVHRGDGVFEAMKAISRSVYLMDEHLQRLWTSAQKIGLVDTLSIQAVKEMILETLKVADQANASIRVFLSRGPGNFSVNPNDSIGPQLYIMIMRLHEPDQEQYTKGVIIGQSKVPVKTSFMAQIKSCNYLVNVLMKKEAIERQLDFVIGIDPEGYITESATENIMIVDQHGTLVHPTWDYILKGTTLLRTCELARANGIKTAMRPIPINELKSAREVLIVGTTLNILPVIQFEDIPISQGKPGPMAQQLNHLLLKDIQQGHRGIPY